MFSLNRISPLAGLTALFLAALPGSAAAQTKGSATNPLVTYGTETIEGLDIFYREAGRPGAPHIVLLHGFPTSSHMFRNVIPLLAEDFHVIAPDYPGYGLSSMPGVEEFEYSFAHVASIVDELLARRGFDRYALYLMDYGAPVGYRIAESHPERVTALIVQNGNAYDERACSSSGTRSSSTGRAAPRRTGMRSAASSLWMRPSGSTSTVRETRRVSARTTGSWCSRF